MNETKCSTKSKIMLYSLPAQGNRTRLFFTTPRNKEVVQAELPRMAVVPCSSGVLCTHKTRLQRLYTDVQPLKMVQMLAQSPDFAITRTMYLLVQCSCQVFAKSKNLLLLYITAIRGGNVSDVIIRLS